MSEVYYYLIYRVAEESPAPLLEIGVLELCAEIRRDEQSNAVLELVARVEQLLADKTYKPGTAGFMVRNSLDRHSAHIDEALKAACDGFGEA